MPVPGKGNAASCRLHELSRSPEAHNFKNPAAPAVQRGAEEEWDR
jgi:hypothetical protein